MIKVETGDSCYSKIELKGGSLELGIEAGAMLVDLSSALEDVMDNMSFRAYCYASMRLFERLLLAAELEECGATKNPKEDE